MALGSTDVLFTIPLSTYYLYNATQNFVSDWDWNLVHNTDYDVVSLPGVIWRAKTSTFVNIELTRWIYVLTALLFFGFFGLGEEAKTYYGLMATSTLRVFHRSMGTTVRSQTDKSLDGSLPTFNDSRKPQKISTFASFDSEMSQGNLDDEKDIELPLPGFNMDALNKV